MKQKPSFNEERFLWQQGFSAIAGIDEVGRGAFAGPVVIAAVIFPKQCVFSDPELHDIHDSKLLTPHKRQRLAEKIKREALSFSTSEIPVSYINRFGVGKAAQLGFYKVATTLSIKPDFFLIDAFWITRLKKSVQKPIIHGDSLSISIAAASIIAKVYRDEIMQKIHLTLSDYGFDQNKGYGTKIHQEQLRKLGASQHHRTSFIVSTLKSY